MVTYIFGAFLESLKAIAETIHVTMEISGLNIPYTVGNLEKWNPKTVTKGQNHIELPNWQGFPRNASEGQLSAFKQVGKWMCELYRLFFKLFIVCFFFPQAIKRYLVLLHISLA